jgi:HEAT repeat protein
MRRALVAAYVIVGLATPAVALGDTPVDEAIAKLSSPATWCDGAAELVKRGDPTALNALVKAYKAPHETSKLCLLDAMEALGAKSQAATVYAQDARIGLDLMRLFPDDAHLPVLATAVESEDAQTRFIAIRALTTQLQDAAWISTCIPLLGSPRLDVRKAVVEVLGRRDEPEVLAALKAQSKVEPDAALKSQLELIVGP